MSGLDHARGFGAYVAHELRTPIALQLALAEAALTDTHADTVTLRAMGEAVIASCEQQQRLIEALLDLAQGQGGAPRQQPVDIAAIVGEALQAHHLGELDSDVTLAPALTTGDPTLLGRLAGNLVSNAIRHNIPRGRIEIATGTQGRSALLSVVNTGPLIPAGELPRLFEPFERLGWGDGAGLGLAIVQSIADAHNATLVAHARAGGGLEVQIRFSASVTNMAL